MFWLVKTEPESFSFDDLLASPGATTSWDGVRNYQARNFLREMKEGERVLVYHSKASPPGVVGLAEVVRAHYLDPSQFDPEHSHYDAGATRENPRWLSVDLRALKKLARPVSLPVLKAEPVLTGMALTRRGNRLSVMPVMEAEFEAIMALARFP